MNLLIRELGQLVPAAADRKLDKLTVLRLALTHVHVLCSDDGGELEASGTSKSLPPSEILALLQQGTPNFLTVLDLEQGRIEWVSDGTKETVGWEANELVGASWIDFVHSEDLDIFKTLLLSLHTSDRTTENFYSEQVSSSSAMLLGSDAHPGLKRSVHFRMKTRVSGQDTEPTFVTLRGYGFVKYTYASRGLLLVVRDDSQPHLKRGFEMKVSKQGLILQAEDSVYSSTGLFSQNYVGHSYYDFVYEGDLITTSRVHNQALNYENGKGVSSAYRLRTSGSQFLVTDTYWSRFDNPFTQEVQFITVRHEPRKPRSDKEATAEQSTLMQLLSAKKTTNETPLPTILGVARLGSANSNTATTTAKPNDEDKKPPLL